MKAIFIAIALLLSASVAAEESRELPQLDPEAFQQRKAEIEREIAVGDAYAEISERERHQVLDALKSIELLLSDASTLRDLTPDQRVALFNHQELVNNILTEVRAQSRMICVREHTVGTRFKVNNCKTLAERERARTHSQDGLLRRQTSNLVPPEEPRG